MPRPWLSFLLSCLLSSSWTVVNLRADGPTLKRLFPAGAGRGQTVQVAALGDAPIWPVEVWCDDPAVQWKALSDKSRFEVTVGAEARLGVHHVRFYDKDNASDAHRFIIGPIAEQNELEPNDGLDELTPIAALPTVINGVLSKRGDVDTFAIDLKEQQILIAEVEANEHLKSPVDATLQVLSAKGTVLAQNLDRVGLDPRLEFMVPSAGRYHVRVFGTPSAPDSTIAFAGNDNFVYRLSLSEGGWLRATRPMAVDLQAETTLRLQGIGLPISEVLVKLPEGYTRPTWFLDIPGVVNALPIDVLDIQQSVEALRPDDGKVPALSIPISITGSLNQANERDFYSFTATKGNKLRFTLVSNRLGHPLDGVLRVLELSGKELTREDDNGQQRDARMTFTPPADGQYVLEVSDAYGNAGPEWIYRIDATQVVPDVVLTVKADHFQGKAGENLEIPVTIDRQDGFDGTIELTAISANGRPLGPAVTSSKDSNAKEAKLVVKAESASRGPIRIVATRSEQETWQRSATVAGDPLLSDLWLTIR